MKSLIYIISDFLETPRGYAICGSSVDLDSLEHHEIIDFIGAGITVDLPEGISSCRVLEVQSTMSLIGRKNVFILLENCDVNSSWIGRSVFREEQ